MGTNKKILIVDHDDLGKLSLNEAILQEKLGTDLVVLTTQEALEQNVLDQKILLDADIIVDQKKPYLLTSIERVYPLKSGKAKRRERRASERRAKKNKRP